MTHLHTPPVSKADITGVVLAGGRATRMNGCDKGLVDFLGQPLAQTVYEKLLGQCSNVFINANRNQTRYERLGARVVSDATGEFLGPLAGILQALKLAQTPWIVTAPCDSPFFPQDYVQRLMQALQNRPGQLCAAVQAQGKRQPVFTMIHRSAADSIEQFLAGGGRKVGQWLQENSVDWVEFDRLDQFDNINTVTELERAVQKTSSV